MKVWISALVDQHLWCTLGGDDWTGDNPAIWTIGKEVTVGRVPVDPALIAEVEAAMRGVQWCDPAQALHQGLGSAPALASPDAYIARQVITDMDHAPWAYQVSYRCHPLCSTDTSDWSPAEAAASTQQVFDATLGHHDLDDFAHGLPLVVRTPRDFLLGQRTLPQASERLVLAITDTDVDDVRQLTDLRSRGFRLLLNDFTGTETQLNLVPHVDVVSIDVRDLDVEGSPVVRAARAHGALLLGRFVETTNQLHSARTLGFDLMQGYLVQRPLVMHRTTGHWQQPSDQ